MIILSGFVELLALLLGPLCVPLFPRMYQVSLRFYLQHFLAFALLFVFWTLLRAVLGKLVQQRARREPHKTKRRKPLVGSGAEIIWLLCFALLTALTLLTLQLFREKFEEYIFSIALGVMSAFVAGDVLLRRGRFFWSSSVYFIASAAMGYLSVLVIANIMWWQPAVLAIALSMMIASVCVARVLVVEEKIPEDQGKLKAHHLQIAVPASREFIVLGRLYVLLVCAAVSAVGLMVMLHHLPFRYMLLFLVFYPAFRLFAELKVLESRVSLPRGFLRDATGLCLLFVIMLLLSAIV